MEDNDKKLNAININKYARLIIGILIGILIGFAIAAFLISLYFRSNSVEIFNDNIEKTVEIRCSNDSEAWGYATGCFIDSEGAILTNKHVVKSNNSENSYKFIEVRLAKSNSWGKAEVVKMSEGSDLAIIKIDSAKNKFFKLAKSAKNGEKIYTIGNPNGFGLSFSEGVISSSLREVTLHNESRMALQTDFVINGGNSGGPVFNSRGKLVGLMSFRLKDNMNDVIQGVSFAVPISEIIEFI